jgi:hypothetical protein
MVVPVVVNPDTDSKKASKYDCDTPEKRKGNAPSADATN